MADDITYTSASPAGPPDALKQVTDEHVTRGHMPVIKIAYSADGSATLVGVDVNGVFVQGGIADDAADAGNPDKIGGKARTADRTAVAASDRVDAYFDVLGRIVTSPYTLHENLLSGATAVITTTGSTEVIAAQAASTRIYVTSLTVVNSDASVGTVVALTDGSGGTVLHRGYAAAAGGGYTITFPTPLRGSAATALHAICATTSAEVYVSASGYKSLL
jgi:hypothetical protein